MYLCVSTSFFSLMLFPVCGACDWKDQHMTISSSHSVQIWLWTSLTCCLDTCLLCSNSLIWTACYGLNVCITSNYFTCWNSYTQCDGIRRWDLSGGDDVIGGSLVHGISALINEIPQSSLAPFTTGRYKRKFEAWKRALPHGCWHPDLRLLASRTMRHKFLLLFFFS